MQFLHAMLRVTDPDASLRFFALLGLEERRRRDYPAGRFTLIYLAAPGDEAEVELREALRELRDLARGIHPSVLVDQGLDDKFLASELKPEMLEAACLKAGQPLTLRRHAGYDHSYYFISTFMSDHLRHHARQMG